MNQAHTIYKQTSINTSNPMKIVLLLYEGAIGYLKKAVEYAEGGDTKNKNVYSNKARDIIVELNGALDIQIGGELAQALRRLYFFMDRHLMKSNWKNEVQGLKEVLHLLTDLHEAWQEAYDRREDHNYQRPPHPAESGLRV